MGRDDRVLPLTRVVAVVIVPFLLFQVAGLMLTLILLAGVRARHEFTSTNPLTWLFGVGFVGLLAAIGVLYLRMRARALQFGDE
jgi:hypothetical protein